jgi:hypothetical protein
VDPRKLTITPPSSLSLIEAVLLLAYFSIRTLLQQPGHIRFVNPVSLLEMSRLDLLIRSREFVQAVNVGFLDTIQLNSFFSK